MIDPHDLSVFIARCLILLPVICVAVSVVHDTAVCIKDKIKGEECRP